MKTPEEICLAVLKECGRRVDANDTVIIAGDLPVWVYECNHCVMEDGKLRQFFPSSPTDKREKGYTINSLGMNLHLWSGATDQEWAFAYRLLNIEARELEERANGLAAALEESENTINNWETQGYMDHPEVVGLLDTIKQVLNQWKGGGK